MNSTLRSWIFVIAIALLGIYLVPQLFQRSDVTYYGYVPHQSISISEVQQAVENPDTAARPIKKLVVLTDELGHPVSVVVSLKGGEQFLMRSPGESYISQLVNSANRANIKVESEVHPKMKIDWDQLQDAKGSSTTGMWMGILLPPILIIGFMYWMSRRMPGGGVGGGSQHDKLAQSKAKELTGELVKVRFTDVAGCEEAKEELTDVVAYLKDPAELKKLGGKLPKGILMQGPPGTGKTLLAKAVAGEAGVPFFFVSASEFVEMFVGVGAARVRDMFDKVRAKKPCILFIDELDAVGKHRGTGIGGGNDEREQTINQILTEMDGFEDGAGIVIIGATNRPDVLDPALLRPGRFGDMKVTVSLPDRKGREEILAVHARDKSLASDVSLSEIALRTPGYSGADLAATLNNAAIIAARRIRKSVSALVGSGLDLESAKAKVASAINMEDIDTGIESVQMGTSSASKSRRLSDEVKRLIAVHELGHAAAAEWLFHSHGNKWNEQWGAPVRKITIIGIGGAGGYTMAHNDLDSSIYTEEALRGRIIMALAANRAEQMFLGTTTTGAQNDFKQGYEMAKKMVTQWGMSGLGPISVGGDEGSPFLGKTLGSLSAGGYGLGTESSNQIDREIKKILDECGAKAEEILRSCSGFIDKMVPVLIEKETILRHDWEPLWVAEFGKGRKDF